ncbi:MAG: hypothetical protein A2Y62_18050 [Candidatus Fischerbacteria bacterium RBG_13_37_8]|uniref:Phage head morphogenesis domain-containing protein n=1 Tax=Candidatus Fischerbacteria bacterium RBG_13_37_8 TaxID=1817863 RepID=A0A1F5VWC4_9BACT|nr:MAG: hypothetical protein A2Y62_18050 [Candidatus Fischerbacteria bacterium RBG_13_37_8]
MYPGYYAIVKAIKSLKAYMKEKDIESNFPSVPFKEAIENLKARTIIDHKEYKLLSDCKKRKYFTLAKVQSFELIQVIKDKLIKGMQEGQTSKMFIDNVHELYDSLELTRLDGAYLENIYRTNTFSAYMAGRAQEIQNHIESIKYLRFLSAPTACEKYCLPLNNHVAAPSDAFWTEHFPILHYNCRCDVEIILYEEDPNDEIKPSPMQKFPKAMKGFGIAPWIDMLH